MINEGRTINKFLKENGFGLVKSNFKYVDGLSNIYSNGDVVIALCTTKEGSKNWYQIRMKYANNNNEDYVQSMNQRDLLRRTKEYMEERA